MHMTRLSININKIATLRNARGNDLPNLLKVALDVEKFGSQGITVHPRPDERHIKVQDVYDLAQQIKTEFNIEGYPSDDFIALILNIRPEQVTLVPDPSDVLTSNAGWRLPKNLPFLRDAIVRLKLSGARISIFIDPFDYQDSDLNEIIATGTDAIELYTERYAKYFHTPLRDDVLSVYEKVAHRAHDLGLIINAGHDLNLDNLAYFISKLNCVAEVSIGHALICDALYFGLEETVKRYLGSLTCSSSHTNMKASAH